MSGGAPLGRKNRYQTFFADASWRDATSLIVLTGPTPLCKRNYLSRHLGQRCLLLFG